MPSGKRAVSEETPQDLLALACLMGFMRVMGKREGYGGSVLEMAFMSQVWEFQDEAEDRDRDEMRAASDAVPVP